MKKLSLLLLFLIVIAPAAYPAAINYVFNSPPVSGDPITCPAGGCATLTVSEIAGQPNRLALDFAMPGFQPEWYSVKLFLNIDDNVTSLSQFSTSNSDVGFDFSSAEFTTHASSLMNAVWDFPNSAAKRLGLGDTLSVVLTSSSSLNLNSFVEFSDKPAGLLHIGALANGGSTQIPLTTIPNSPVPEPGSLVLAAIGAGGILLSKFLRPKARA